MTRPIIRVLIADDHNLVRGGIVSLLDSIDDIYVVGEADNGHDLVNRYFEINPDVVLCDISMPGMSGIDAVKQIRKGDPEAKVLFVSVYEGDEYVYQVLNAGGKGLVHKSIVKGELILAIKSVFQGIEYFGKGYDINRLNEIIEKYSAVNTAGTASPGDEVQLSPRELEVLRLVCEGLSSAEIGVKLGISRKTVETHRGSLMKKLKATSSSQLIKYAILNKII
ncbi:MAG TPA: response regulator transcription factor [Ignavibacteriales bacterium]|nr:response regulator transcription factor [Ignavibacteriales bacterium]